MFSPSESAELTELDARFGARARWSGTWEGSLALWRRVVIRFTDGYGSGGHRIDDLAFDVGVRDLIQEFIEAASPELAKKLAREVVEPDDRYRSATVEGAQLLDALAESRPDALAQSRPDAWWWNRIPRFGPLHDLIHEGGGSAP